MKLHILRPLIVFVVLVGLILFARSLFLPKDFATNERGYRFGWHRFGNEQEWKDFPVKYVGSDTCTACHADKGTQILASWHKDNQCENCHGPYQEGHSKENPLMVVDKTTGLCLRCHAELPAAFEARSKIKFMSPYPDGECVSCHNPHTASFVEAGK